MQSLKPCILWICTQRMSRQERLSWNKRRSEKNHGLNAVKNIMVPYVISKPPEKGTRPPQRGPKCIIWCSPIGGIGRLTGMTTAGSAFSHTWTGVGLTTFVIQNVFKVLFVSRNLVRNTFPAVDKFEHTFLKNNSSITWDFGLLFPSQCLYLVQPRLFDLLTA